MDAEQQPTTPWMQKRLFKQTTFTPGWYHAQHEAKYFVFFIRTRTSRNKRNVITYFASQYVAVWRIRVN